MICLLLWLNEREGKIKFFPSWISIAVKYIFPFFSKIIPSFFPPKRMFKEKEMWMSKSIESDHLESRKERERIRNPTFSMIAIKNGWMNKKNDYNCKDWGEWGIRRDKTEHFWREKTDIETGLWWWWWFHIHDDSTENEYVFWEKNGK